MKNAILIITLFLTVSINYLLSFTEVLTKKDKTVIFMLVFLCAKAIYESK